MEESKMNVNTVIPVCNTQGAILADITNVVANDAKNARTERRLRLQQKRKFPFTDDTPTVNPMVGQSDSTVQVLVKPIGIDPKRIGINMGKPSQGNFKIDQFEITYFTIVHACLLSYCSMQVDIRLSSVPKTSFRMRNKCPKLSGESSHIIFMPTEEKNH